MDGRKTNENRWAIVGLTLLTVITLVVFAFCFLGMGDFFSGDGEDPSVKQTDSSTDTSSTDSEQRASLMADVQMKMNKFQTQLSSPYILIVNEKTPLPEGYDVGELAALNGYETLQLEKAAAEKFNEFLVAADKAGFDASLTAAYRSEKQQEKAYNDAVQSYMNAGYPAETARTMAKSSVGLVGTSEHQLGLAVDFTPKEMSLLGADGNSFEEFLSGNMHLYGFILSYPAGEEDQTGHEANTVHYRYVGVEAAKEMKTQQWTLPEYRDYLQTQIDYLKQYLQSLEKGGEQ